MKLKTNINPNYKTKKCIQFYENGYCPYGIRCQFLHKEQFSTDNPEGLNTELIGNTNPNINKDNTYSSTNVTINNELSNKLSMGSVPKNNTKNFYSPQTFFGGVSQVSKELSYQKLMEKLMNSYTEDTEVVNIKDHKNSADDYSSR